MPLAHYHGKGGPLEVPSLDDSLWRYMDFARFTAMLVNGLYLRRVDRLDDAFEGFVPLHNIRHGFPEVKQFYSKLNRRVKKQSATSRRYYYVSCWHGNDEESDAMWKLYVKGDGGIAIRTSPRLLTKALKDGTETLWIGNVNYCDYNDPPAFGTLLHACMAKRKPFQHEREVRLIWFDEHSARLRKTHCPDGICVQCNVGDMIDRVCVAPASSWFKPIVEDVLERYNIAIEVIDSSVLRKPPA